MIGISVLPTLVTWIKAITRSTIIVEFPYQPFKVRDVLFGQFPVSAKVRHERSHATIKQSAQKTCGFAGDPFITLEYCEIQILSAIFLSADGSFVKQTIQQRLDRCFLPIGLVQGGDDVFRCDFFGSSHYLHDH